MFTTLQGIAMLIGIIGIVTLALCVWSIVDYEIECYRKARGQKK